MAILSRKYLSQTFVLNQVFILRLSWEAKMVSRVNIISRRFLHNHGDIAAKTGTMLYSYIKWLEGFSLVYSTIGSTVHPVPLNSLWHYGLKLIGAWFVTEGLKLCDWFFTWDTIQYLHLYKCQAYSYILFSCSNLSSFIFQIRSVS